MQKIPVVVSVQEDRLPTIAPAIPTLHHDTTQRPSTNRKNMHTDRNCSRYLGGGVKVLGEPDDPECFLRTGANPLDNERNQTSYILNGFSDAGAFGNEEISVRLLSLGRPVHTVLMSGQSGTGNFYMDFAEGNQNDVLNKAAYGDGSNYLFADGSVRFLRAADYDDTLWLVDKSQAIPSAQ